MQFEILQISDRKERRKYEAGKEARVCVLHALLLCPVSTV